MKFMTESSSGGNCSGESCGACREARGGHGKTCGKRKSAAVSAVEGTSEEKDVQDDVCKSCLNGGAGRHKKLCSKFGGGGKG